MTKIQRQRQDEFTDLKKSGVDVQKRSQIRPNVGSETFQHFVAKAAVAHIGINNGYKVASEVQLDNEKEIDVLLWGCPDRLTYAVEAQHGWTDETTAKKIERYVTPYAPIDDMLKVEVNDLPENTLDILGNVSEQLGLDL